MEIDGQPVGTHIPIAHAPSYCTWVVMLVTINDFEMGETLKPTTVVKFVVIVN